MNCLRNTAPTYFIYAYMHCAPTCATYTICVTWERRPPGFVEGKQLSRGSSNRQCAAGPVDRPIQLICVSDIYLLCQQTNTKAICAASPGFPRYGRPNHLPPEGLPDFSTHKFDRFPRSFVRSALKSGQTCGRTMRTARRRTWSGSPSSPPSPRPNIEPNSIQKSRRQGKTRCWRRH